MSDLTVACNQENTGRQVTDQFLSIMSFLQPLVCHNLKLEQFLILVQPTWETSRQHLSTLIDVFAIYYLEKKIQLIFVLEEKHELPILTGLVLRKRGGGQPPCFIDVRQGMKNELIELSTLQSFTRSEERTA